VQFARSLLIAVVFACAAPAWAEEQSLPLIQESVDEICIVRLDGYSKLIFFRDGAVLATRHLSDDMMFIPVGDHFQCIWRDYWTAERVVDAAKLSVWDVAKDPTHDSGEWWCAWRVMTDLRQP
jgi:hypothetical protein